jgi:hypothetical protein
MTRDLSYARPRVRGPRSLLTAAIVITLALSLLTMAGPTANAAGPASISLGAADSFAVLSAADGAGGAVTCVNTPAGTTIIGNVGSSGLPAAVVTDGCVITGTITAPVPAGVVAAFDHAYAALAGVPCTRTILTEAFTGPTTAFSVGPGVTCFPNEVTFTNTTLTLVGNGPWLFKVGTGTAGSGALTGTNFNVVMPAGGSPCDVTWWVRAAATMTTSQFIGTILAGAAISVTSGGVGTFHGRALAKAAVTIIGGTLTGCTGGNIGGGGGGQGKAKCNQGVGNGPETCDPGNSNQGDPSRSNDELGGTPGSPGRQGGNGK